MRRFPYILVLIIIGLIPLIIHSSLIFAVEQTSILQFHIPYSDTPESATSSFFYIDEKWHWHQITTFTAVQFEGGYYNFKEAPAQNEAIHFFAWGPYPSIFYGTIFALTGNPQFMFVVVNALLFALGFVALGLTVKLSPIQLATLSIIIATQPVILLYFSSTMLEMLNITLAVWISVLYYQVYLNKSWRWFVACVCLIVIASLIRATWLVLLPPLLMMLGYRQYRWKGVATGMIVSLLIGGVIFIHYISVAAPTEATGSFASVDTSLISILLARIGKNLQRFFFDAAPFFLLRFTALLTLGFLLWQLWIKRADDDREELVTQFIFHLANIGGVVVLLFVAYFIGDNKDFRIIGVHLLLSLIVMVLDNNYRVIIPPVMVMILMLPTLTPTIIQTIEAHYYEYDFDFEAYTDDLDAVGIRYTPSDNAWCNTVLIDRNLAGAHEYWVGIPAGMGFSQMSHPNSIETPVPQSQFILLSDMILEEIPDTWRLETLLDISVGSFYRNLDAEC